MKESILVANYSIKACVHVHRDAIVAIVAIVTSLKAPQKLNNMWNRHGQGAHVASMQVRSIYKLVDSRSCGTTLVGRAWTRFV